ncbi:MAG TPA: calcium-binding protein, partial [Capillimicrobium sp.]|nr:calcium-binding protein [Capillimicrobium sp.]
MRRLALLPAVVALALPGAAAAGTVSMTGEYVEGYKGSGGWEYDVRYAAEPGEPNALSVWREPGAVVVVDDAGVAAGTGCESRSATEAVCAPPRTQPGWIRVTAHLGDRDDRLAATTAVAATGDDGDDRLESPGGGLEGGPGDDVLVTPAGSGTGGPGDDRVVAGTARYDDRSEPVVVDLAAGTAVLGDEHDALVGVRDVVAGRGNDRVTGSAEANRIETGAGDDVVLGGAGDDWLDGQLGFDQLDGGDGDDVLWAGGYQDTAPNVVLGGAGGDDLHGSWGPDRLVGGTGRDHLAGDRGHDETDARDGEADFVGCRLSATNPHARVVADRLDLVRHCGPLERDGVP